MTRFGRLSALDVRPHTETAILICEGHCNPGFGDYLGALAQYAVDETSVRRMQKGDGALHRLRTLAGGLAYTPHVPRDRRPVLAGDAVSIEMECCLCGSVRRFGLEAV